MKSRLDRIVYDGIRSANGINAKDVIEMFVSLDALRVNHLDVALVLLHTLGKRLAEHKHVLGAVDDRVRRERAGEPDVLPWVEDAATVREASHVPVEELRARTDGKGAEELGLLPVDPLLVAEAEEVLEG